MTHAAVFVELLDRSGTVVARHRCQALPIRFGRAYDNDVIVDDPFVAPAHLIIDARPEDGALVARDGGTRNGIHVVELNGRRVTPGPARAGAIVLTPDTVVRAGHTAFRVRTATQSVAPERLDRTAHAWEGIRPGIAGLAIIGIGSAISGWADHVGAEGSVGFVSGFAVLTGIVIAWVAAWALLNRLLGGRARLGRHLLIAGVGLIGIDAFTELLEMAGYSLSVAWPSMYGSYIAFAALSLVVYLHGRTIWPLTPAFARKVALGAGALAISATALTQYAGERRVADSLYMTDLKAPAIRIAPATSSEAFAEALLELKARADLRRGDVMGEE
jgi:hypothetical protein